MNLKVLLLLICIATAVIAGCTAGPPSAATPSPPPSPAVTVITTSGETTACTADADCVPAPCCHPTSCTSHLAKQPCNVMCTMSCEGPIDCGAGSCGCVKGKCGIVAAGDQAPRETAVKIEASPQRYSPMMSSTPGIGLTPHVTGFTATDATFEWNATFGRFLMWDAPDYKVHDIGNPVATDNRTIYWTFTDKPASTKEPVTITVTARDTTRRGAALGTSAVILNWDGDYAVYVGEIR
jgi:hypothetical protein